MLWFNFILGLIFIFFCLQIIIIHYHTQKQNKIKFKPRIKLNHNIYTRIFKHESTERLPSSLLFYLEYPTEIKAHNLKFTFMVA